MIAFHGQQEIKNLYLSRVRAHAAADEIIKGCYWENGKGCAVGCTIHGDSHHAYEKELGIPVQIAYLEDTLFENLTNGDAKQFPEKFLSAIPVGANLSHIIPKFFVWLLLDPERGVIRFADPRVEPAIRQVADYHQKILDGFWKDAESAARSAWSAAESAARSARSAARSARSTAWSARSAAWSAAESAAWSARSAARSAWSAAESAAESAARSARSAAWSARSAACSARSAARSAWSAAESAQYKAMAEKLLQLLSEAPIV